MKKIRIKRFVSVFMALVVFSTCFISSNPVKSRAATLQEQKEAYNAKIQSAESEIARLKKEKASEQEIADQLEAQLNDLTSQAYIIQCQRNDIAGQIDNLNKEIDRLKKEIKNTEQKLSDMNNEIDNTVDLFCKRIRSNYMSGPTSYLEVLLDSKDISSMLNQLELMKRVTDSDQKLVNKLNADIVAAEKLKEELKNDKEEAETKKTELSAKKVELDASQKEYDELILSAEAKAEEVNRILNGYDSKIEALHEDISNYKDDEAKIDKAIKEAEKQRQQSSYSSGGGSTSYPSTGGYGNGTVSTSGWMFPVPAAYISSYYGYRSDPATGATKFHAGIDLAAPCNSDILATKSGYVVFIKYGNTGYGNHIMIGHSDGTYSLYAHCLTNFPVSVGQTVSQGQVIAHVGTSGYSTGYHCHFEIRDSGGTQLNPLNYVHK